MMASTPESRAAEAERGRQRRQQQDYRDGAPSRAAESVGQTDDVDDNALIAEVDDLPHVRNPMIMQRRLKDAVQSLTGELVTFRKSADAAAARSEAAAARLERLTRWLIAFTIGLFALTAVLIAKG